MSCETDSRNLTALPEGDRTPFMATGAAPAGTQLWPVRASRALARAEARFAGCLVALMLGVVLVNLIFRVAGHPLIWGDELAVNLMIWAALTGASLGLAHRQHISVDLVPGFVGPKAQRLLAIAVDLVLIGFFVTLAVLLWQWFDLPGLIAAGSAEAHGAATFNFIWSEPTVTLGLRRVWFWLILPIFCLTGFVHVSASLIDRLTGGFSDAGGAE